MYGLIQRYLNEPIIDGGGEEFWRSIARELRIGPVDLISQDVYDDALT
jgi:hypothetical protein